MSDSKKYPSQPKSEGRSFHYDILKIVKKWKKANKLIHEVTTSANVGAYPVPLGAKPPWASSFRFTDGAFRLILKKKKKR